MIIRRSFLPLFLLLALSLLATALPLSAHHASGPFYDSDKPIEIEGVVTRFVFRNPHAALFLDVTDDSGETAEWQVELTAPVMLRRVGWTPDLLPVGMIVRVAGPSARAEGAKGLLGRKLTRADGSPILKGGSTQEPTPAR
ncbi:MAG: DUF6152 family protein [Proteobacteria bacterium]|nr:DUF6152 family protein [Pseudomonadota bacterium]MDA1243516.1 DUF6152 family protein [Pseudomonadota bacterium]